MARYAQAFKDKAAARLLPPDSAPVQAVRQQLSISVATLERWRAGPPRGGDWRRAPMDEVSKSAWCRQHGVYPQELEQWRYAPPVAKQPVMLTPQYAYRTLFHLHTLMLSNVNSAGHQMFQKLVSPFKEFGLFAGSVYAIGRALNRVSPTMELHLHDWMVQPITDKQLLPENFANSYETREIKRDDPLVDAMPIRPEVRASRSKQAAICIGTFRGETLIGYLWLSFGTYDEDSARCTFILEPTEQSVFDFDLVILPEFRGGLGFAALWNGTNNYLYRRGVRYSFSRLDHFNRTSARAHDHLGWKRVGGAVILKLGAGLELIFSSIQPRLFLSFNDQWRASIRLTPNRLER